MNREILPPVGEEFAAHIEEFHVRGGMSREEARLTGLALAELMLSVYAGQKVAFPSDPFRAQYLEARNKEIRRRFNGKNAPVLADEYGITRRQVWNIVKSESSTVSRSP